MSTTTIDGPTGGTIGTDPLLPRAHRIASIERETADTLTFDLAPDDGQAMRFAPGQFTMLSVFGVGECAISIAGDPDDPARIIHTIRAVGSVTDRLHRMGAGGAVGIRGPFGTAWPLDEAAGGDLLIVAGGLGLAPVRPAILHALNHRDRYREIVLLLGARTPEDLLYRDELLGWASRDDVDVRITVDTPTGGWRGPVGVVTQLLTGADVDPAETTALVCGPEVMMRHTVRPLVANGIDPDRIHLSLERTMRCGMGTCGHCQLGPVFVCRDGPVFPATRVDQLLEVREL